MNWCNNGKHHLPHFHAYYNEFEASFDFNGEIIAGSFPARQTAFVKAWTLLHQDELNANWKLAIEGEQIFKINPLQEYIIKEEIIYGKPLLARAVSVEALPNFILKIKFNNNETRYFDGKKIYNLNCFKLLQYFVRNFKRRKRVKSEGKFQNSGLM